MGNHFLSTIRQSVPVHNSSNDNDLRTEFEKDHDRILFSAPIRRLADKTQVFPLETNDSVRTRLTHSHEVSNLCRSLALQIFRKDKNAFVQKSASASGDDVSVIAAAAGLAHDVGNPPFGHQGEEAIRTWFLHKNNNLLKGLSKAQKQDLHKWEGNAQAFRLVTRLQVAKGNCGLNLTYATLASLMKYTVPSDEVSKKEHPAKGKFGYFQADKDVANKVLAGVGLKSGKRHALAYVMEACDDIAYSVIDVEDAISKGLVSLNDVLAELSNQKDKHSKFVRENVENKIIELRDANRSLGDIRDISLEYFRSYTIAEMIVAARDFYIENKTEILAGEFEANLVKSSSAGDMCEALQAFARVNAFQSAKVTELELEGSNLIHSLMDYFWKGIDECSLDFLKKGTTRQASKIKKSKLLKPKETTLFGKFAYSLISDNYRSVFETSTESFTRVHDVRYNQLLLLADMISGMTEDFVIEVHGKLSDLDMTGE